MTKNEQKIKINEITTEIKTRIRKH